ncbi:pyridoxamine 5'-phosphate oxidase family protein [Gandjariella thermophila]|uniref:Pyridoxamine 5'-phosphate oxidase n=1 Tax=Gandjariella thermophila TaxID=1931992 RepID=A0A4D4J1N2_9PSEU|nr:pyridoxamine 5'-phosphate oxidase family protein [Gandjariella thermophila]GDY28698.1 pyridoxamine 5'-phosphate oxidase [Gandjariella thermophila]
MFDSAGLEVLDRAECLRLLQSVPVGRIVFTDQALPAVQPINFAILDESVLFRTSHGSKLSAATRNAIVAFEADDFDNGLRNGWSVVIVGHATEVLNRDELRRINTLPLRSWMPAGPEHVIRISIERIAGRRVRHTPAVNPASQRATG